jgi:hypothetical protein
VRRQTLRNYLAADRFWDGFGASGDRADAAHLLARLIARLFVRFLQYSQEESDDGVNVDAGIDLGRRLGDLRVEQCLERAAGSDLRRNCRTG